MKYLDVFHEIFGEEWAHYPKSHVLAWTANYETAVFDIQDEVHPATKWVWFQWWIYKYTTPPKLIGERLVATCGPRCVDTIYKCELKDGKWEIAEERSDGRIPFVNYNPFKPSGNAASNTAESKFPQNQDEVVVDESTECGYCGAMFPNTDYLDSNSVCFSDVCQDKLARGA